MSEERLPKVKARALATITLEISLTDAWGGDCPLSQIHKQGVASALNELRLMVAAVSGDRVRIDMPVGARILHFGVQYEAGYLWALVDPTAPLERRRFRLAGTGHPIVEPLEALVFIGTIMFAQGSLVFHLFEIVELPQ